MSVQVERKQAAAETGVMVDDDPRTIPDDRGNYAIMHAITRGNNSMAALLDACAPAPVHSSRPPLLAHSARLLCFLSDGFNWMEHSCRSADLETILATDLSQLGQVPKLQTLALASLRARLRIDLDNLLRRFKQRDAAGDTAAKCGKVDDDCASGRSFILDGSPKSARPSELPPSFLQDLSSVQLQWLDSCLLYTSPSPRD